jgi:hypothetical protein
MSGRISGRPPRGPGWRAVGTVVEFHRLIDRVKPRWSSSKTSPDFYPATADETLPSSFAGWSNAGMASPGGFWTLSISESPSAAVACSLSAVLEADAPPKYFLSAKAARGILRRADKRGRELPTRLREALSVLATDTTPMEKS